MAEMLDSPPTPATPLTPREGPAETAPPEETDQSRKKRGPRRRSVSESVATIDPQSASTFKLPGSVQHGKDGFRKQSKSLSIKAKGLSGILIPGVTFMRQRDSASNLSIKLNGSGSTKPGTAEHVDSGKAGLIELGGNIWNRASAEIGKLGGLLRKKEDSRHSDVSLAEMNRLDQERRERMRDQGTEDSQYLDDAKLLLQSEFDVEDEIVAIDKFNKLSCWCWLGGKPVQDLAPKSALLEAISTVLQARVADPNYESRVKDGSMNGSGRGSNHGAGKMNLQANTNATATGHLSHLGPFQFGALGFHRESQNEASSLGSLSDNDDLKVDGKVAVAAVKAFSAICRDHVNNQRLAFASGRVMELVEYCCSGVSDIEKKWGIHTLFLIILSNVDAQEIILSSSLQHDLLHTLQLLLADDHWKNWPYNEAVLLMELLGWKPIKF